MPYLRLELPTKSGWTKTPNRLFDRLLPELGDSELRVILVLIRNSIGYHKEARTMNLSFRTLTSKTGRKSEAVAKALASLRARGLVHSGTAGKQQTPGFPGGDALPDRG